MKKFLMLFFVLGVMGVLGACTTDDGKELLDDNGLTTITISFDTEVSGIVFTGDSGNTITIRNESGTSVTLNGLTIGETITLSQEGLVFTPSTLEVTENNQIFNVTVSALEEDEEPDDDDDTDSEEPGDDTNPVDTSLTADVDSVEAVNAALLDDDVDTLVFTSNITGSLVINRLIQVDLNDFTLDGDLSIDTSDEGTLVISEGIITGNLDIDGPSLTVENHSTVEGYVNVDDVASATYVEYGLNNDIRIYANNSHVVIRNTTLQVGVLANDVNVTLEADVETFSAEDSFTGIVVVNAGRIYEAIIYSSDVLLDDTPSVLSGNQSVQFTLPLIEAINVDTAFTLTHGASIQDILNELPETLEIVVDGDSSTVNITDYILDIPSYDLTTLDSQILEITGLFEIPGNVLNGNYLEPVFTVTILSYRDSNDGVTGYPTLDTIEIEYGIVQSLSTIEDEYLPSQVDVTLESGDTTTLDVEWTLELGNFDNTLDTAQTLVFSGELVNLPDGIHNLDEILIGLDVVVKSNPNVLEDPYGQVHVQATIPDAVQIDINVESVSGTFDEATIVVTLNPGYNYIGMRLFTMDTIFEEELTYSSYVSKTGSLHIVIEVEAIDRPLLTDAFDSGDGSELSPLIITNTDQLSNMRYFLDEGYYFKLGNDITFLENEYFTPMTSPNNITPFNGVFDGDLYTIYNYKVTTTDDTEQSAFLDVNDGVIKNVNFMNAEVVSLYRLSADANLVGLNKGLIDNVFMEGSRVGRGGGFVGINEGTITNVEANLTLENTQGGFVAINRGIIDGVDVMTDLVVDTNVLGKVAGFVRYNSATSNGVAVVNDISGTINVVYDNSVNDLNGTYISGFAGSNTGHQDSMNQAMIMSSTLTVNISPHAGEINYILAFIEDNNNLGLISHIELHGEVYGRSFVSGFALYNESGTNPAVISNVTTYVDVYATNQQASGFIYRNMGYGYATQFKASIIESEAYGNVVGGKYVEAFANYQDGILIDSDGFGIVTETDN